VPIGEPRFERGLRGDRTIDAPRSPRAWLDLPHARIRIPNRQQGSSTRGSRSAATTSAGSPAGSPSPPTPPAPRWATRRDPPRSLPPGSRAPGRL